ALWGGSILVKRYGQRPVSPPPPPLTLLEIVLAASSVLINTLITVIGLWFWRAGWVWFRDDWGMGVLQDVLVLGFSMDFLMYCLHRVAHRPWFYRIIHSTHHRFDHPRPLTLFVLHPFETFSFGGLWLVVMLLYHSSWVGMSLYLALNVAFGAIGHLGVEPFPNGWPKLPLLNLLATSTFHAEHHAEEGHNFGFYTLIWDRLFGTLSPEYQSSFERLPE
nr:sterol desaturase family protein [Armatimonadota bacterium]